MRLDPILNGIMAAAWSGTEVGVTLFAPSTIISGALTCPLFFVDWQAEVLRLFQHGEGEGDTFRLPSGRVPDPTPEQIARARAAWERPREPAENAAPPRGQRDEEEIIVIRNARVYSAGLWVQHPYVLVESSKVFAWALGETRAGQQ